MSLIFRLVLIALALALTACASTPVHYHTLLPPMTHEVAAQSPAAFLIDVLPVGIPAQLDQSQLVVRQGQSDMVVLDNERWVSPFGDEVRGALSSELGALLSTQDVAGLPIQSDKPVMKVKVQIRRLDAWPGKQVQLVADWELSFANDPGSARVVHTDRFDEATADGYVKMVSACQRAAVDLAGRIALDARELARLSRPH